MARPEYLLVHTHIASSQSIYLLSRDSITIYKYTPRVRRCRSIPTRIQLQRVRTDLRLKRIRVFYPRDIIGLTFRHYILLFENAFLRRRF